MPHRRWYTAEAVVIHGADLTADERQRALRAQEHYSFHALCSQGLGLSDWQLQEMASMTGAMRSRLADRNYVREHLLHAFATGRLVGLRRLPGPSGTGTDKPTEAGPIRMPLPPPVQPPSPQETPAETDVLEGRVTYRDGTPAAGVAFLVKLADGRTLGGRTDADGRYRITGVRGQAQFSLVDGLTLGKTPDDTGQDKVAVNSKPPGGGHSGPSNGGGVMV